MAFWAGTRSERINALNAYIEKQRLRKEKKAQGIELNSDSDDENPLMFRAVNQEENAEVSDNNINPEMNEFERFLRNTAERPTEDYDEQEAQQYSQNLTEPSTSRESKPWISPGKSTARNKGVVKVIKPTRKKNHSKYQRDNFRRKRTKQKTETELSTDDLLRELSNIISDSEEVSRKMDTSDAVYENFEPLETVTQSEIEEAEVITDEIQVDHNPEYLMNDEYSSMTKRRQKKAKREAKMKELAEQLKKMSGPCPEAEEVDEELII